VARFNPPTIYSAVTDDAGAYRFAAVPPGKYSLRAEKAGYLPGLTGRGARAEVVAGEEAKAGELTLLKHGVISGRVTDSDGEPVEHASVQVLPARPGRGPGGNVGGQTMTDDRGEFRIPRLPSGAYKLMAVRGVNTFATPNASASGEPVLIDAPTFFPSALDIGSASEISLTSGEERGGVEIRLRKTVSVRVSGKVTVEGALDSPVSVTLQPAPSPGGGSWGGGMNGRSAIASTDGKFLIAQVTAGEYLLSAGVYRVGASLSRMTKVRVGQQDVDGVTLALQPLVKVTGRAVAEGGGKLPYGQVNISLRAAEAGIPAGGGGQVKADGTFVLENLQRMRLAVNPIAPRGWFLKSVSVAGQRQAGLEIDLTGGEAVLELSYSNRPGTVSGTVEGTVEGPAVALALPDGGAGSPVLTNLYKTGAVLQTGNTFKIEDVPPGNYLIVACAAGIVQSLGDAAVWERLKSKAVAVKVEEGGTVTASPRLISESDLDEK
jgi:hypothetical protein